MRLGDIGSRIAQQRGHLSLWTPVCLGLGSGFFFILTVEPGRVALVVLVMAIGLVLLLTRWTHEDWRPVLSALSLVMLGGLLAAVRTHMMAAPVLEFRYYGPIEGRIIEIDRSQSDKPRIMLDHVVLERTPVDRTPHRVRVSLHGDQRFLDPIPGMRVILTGHLSPPSRPAEPGGFDFQRHAWFERLGAVGYARTPALVLAPPDGHALWLGRLRQTLSARVRAFLPDQVGAFAAAVTTGDRSDLSVTTLQAMRDSNLAHLLAISGLHVGLLTGVVFTAARGMLALFPAVAMRGASKKWAAVLALMAAGAYLGLSGGTVSTQRAFLMVAVMLIAVMLDRRALTLRSVAVAATLILLLRPEAVLGAGFQMSFAATTALVWVFSELRRFPMQEWPKWARGVLTLCISSLVAGLATAPFGAAHFNQMATYGLLANLTAVPLMGFVVIPAAVIAVCLAPVGAEGIGLWIMGWGIRWILFVAEKVSGLDGAVRHIVQPGPWILPILVFGALWLILWQGRSRFAGFVPITVAFWLWTAHERPDLMIAESGGLVGILTHDGRALSKPKGDGFAARSWLEGDGDAGTQKIAALRAEALRKPGAMAFELAGVKMQLRGGRGVSVETICGGVQVVVVNRKELETAPCLVIGQEVLQRTGAIALRVAQQGDHLEVTTVAERSGARVWNDRAVRRVLYNGASAPEVPATALSATQILQRRFDRLIPGLPDRASADKVKIAVR